MSDGRRKINMFREFDYLLFIPVLLLSIIGMFALNSALRTVEDGSEMFFKQLYLLIAGILCCLIINMIDYKKFKVIGFIGYLISVALLIYVIPKGIGLEAWGSNNWIILPVIGTFQPSEIAKIMMVIVVAIFFESAQMEEKSKKLNYFLAFAVAAITMGLIVLEKDYGMTIVFFFIFAIMLFVSGINVKYVLSAVAAAGVFSVFAWFFLLNDRRKERIFVFLNPELDPNGAGYQALNSIRAIGSGQVTGKGYMQGTSIVPAKETDFIFTVIGEEFGFIGTIIVLILIAWIIIRGMHIAYKSRDLFGTFVATGIVAMFAFNFIQNVGMCIGVVPITGIPLPFLSYGGTAMITNFIAIGILLSISARKKRLMLFVED